MSDTNELSKKEIVNLKVNAAREAFEELKMTTTISSVPNIRLIDIAVKASENTILKDRNLKIYDKNIIQQAPYKNLYSEINEYKKKYKEINKIATKGLIKENKNLTEARDNLIQKLIVSYDEIRELKEDLGKKNCYEN